MAVNRLQAALAAATNEVTVAAANLNFDFTLVKYEAPKEYQALGNVLSTKRKDNAEFGSSHILARQLGALFEDICPATPRLLEAYGKRASEIAEASERDSKPYKGTLFGEYTGIDGTSIWAAATSSKSALHVHLLASMLARVWTAPEAISIWVELVAERKKEIARKVDKGEPINFSLAAAAAQDISRPQLAAWDASARAWLRTADDIFRHRQKQLELIINNIGLPVGENPEVLPSVTKTWSIAVQTMENLICGMPQAVQNGACLVRLSSWHLYPDMSIFSPDLVEVKMDDSLVTQGGVLSLGLSAIPLVSFKGDGVCWSLSLAQLRFYGRPVEVQRALGTDSRITFSQLNLVIFAAAMKEWQLSDSKGNLLAKAVIALVDCINSIEQGSMDDDRFLKLLRDGAVAYAERAIGDEVLNHKLIQLGRRRARSFIWGDGENSDKETSAFFFNLLQPSFFMQALQSTENRIKFLRQVASRLAEEGTPSDAFLIRYPHHVSRSYTWRPGIFAHNRQDGVQDFLHQFATALPFDIEGQAGVFSHHRWETEHLNNSPPPKGETRTNDSESKFYSWGTNVQIIGTDDPESYTYFFLMGDVGGTALFGRRWEKSRTIPEVHITLQDFSWCSEHNLMDPAMLFDMLFHSDLQTHDRLHKTLSVLTHAGFVYDGLPDATIDVGILTRSLIDRRFARECFGHVAHRSITERFLSFSFIAYLSLENMMWI